MDFPSKLIPPLAVLQALTYLAMVFGDSSCLRCLKITELFSLMPFLTKKRIVDSTVISLSSANNSISPVEYHNEHRGDVGKKGLE